MLIAAFYIKICFPNPRRLQNGRRVPTQTTAARDACSACCCKVPAAWTRPYQFPVLVSLAFLIYIFGPLSGASFNPAVNMFLLVRGEMSTRKFFSYSAAQLAAGAAAAKLLWPGPN